MVKLARKIVILILGFTVLLIGLAMVFLPGPAIVVIPVGLAILATEFVWAKKILQKVKAEGGKLTSQVLRKKN